MFGGINKLWKSARKKIFTGAFLFGIVLCGALFLPEVSFAQTSSGGGSDWTNGEWTNAFFTTIGTLLATLLDIVGNAIGSLSLVIIEVLVVNVLSYNNFSNSSIVTLGWTLTRDMVNVFAVIVLLVLAIKTMIDGKGLGAWQQHLPRFFLGIVFANFSRTICGLAVDFSQVIMMTFVNALMSIAAGNFAQLMVMPQATAYSAETFQTSTELGLGIVTLATNLANAYVKLMVQVAVMATMLLLAIAFIWRIVMLWIAFIMAPLAGFAWGSMGIVSKLGRVWTEWVQSFVPPLTLGPMLAFFLYLALAASSNGHLAKAEAFPEPENTTTYGQITLEIFESSNFTGLLIAIVFLVLGIRESAKTAASMGGLAAMAFKKDTEKDVLRFGSRIAGATVGNLAKTTARIATGTANIGFQGAGLAAKKVGLERLGKGFENVGNAANDFVKNAPTDIVNAPNYLKRQASTLGDAARKGMLDRAAKRLSSIEVKRKEGDGLGATVYNATMNGLGRVGNSAINPLLAASSAMSGFEAKLSEEDKKAAKERVSKMNDQERAAKLQQAILGSTENSLEAAADAKHLKGLLLTDSNFAKKFKESAGADYDKNMIEIMKQMQAEEDENALSIDKAAWDKIRTKHADLYLAAAGEEKAKKFMSSDDFNAKNIGNDALQNEKLIMALASVTTNDKVNGKFQTRIDQLNDRQKDKVAEKAQSTLSAFNEKMFTRKAGAAPDISEMGSMDDNLRALSRIEGAGKITSTEVQKKIAEQLKEITDPNNARSKKFNEDEVAAIRKRLIESGVKIEDAFGGSVPYDQNFVMKNDQRKAVRSLVSQDASVIRQMDTSAFAGGDTDVAKEVFNALSKESINKMKEQVNSGALAEKEAKEALDKIQNLVSEMEKKVYDKAGMSKADIEQLSLDIKGKADQLKSETDEKVIKQLEAQIKALETTRNEVNAKMDKDTLNKIKELRASEEATRRYI